MRVLVADAMLFLPQADFFLLILQLELNKLAHAHSHRAGIKCHRRDNQVRPRS